MVRGRQRFVGGEWNFLSQLSSDARGEEEEEEEEEEVLGSICSYGVEGSHRGRESHLMVHRDNEHGGKLPCCMLRTFLKAIMVVLPIILGKPYHL